jgi:hypothetical protein
MWDKKLNELALSSIIGGTLIDVYGILLEHPQLLLTAALYISA